MKKLVIYDNKPSNRSTDDLEIDFKDLEKYAEDRLREEIVKLSDKKIGGKKIFEWFGIENISLWWFMFPTIYPKLNEAILFIDRFLNFLDEQNVQHVTLKSNFDKIDIIKKICHKKNIKFTVSTREFFSYTSKQFSKRILKQAAYKKITLTKHKKRLNFYKKRKKFQYPSLGSVIITSPGIYRRDSLNPVNGKIIKEEFFIQPILDLLLKNKISHTCIDFDYTFKGTTKILAERLGSKHDWIPVELLFEEAEENFVKKSFDQLKNAFSKFKENDLKNEFCYKGISLWDYIQPTFEELFFEPYLPTYLRLISAVEQFFVKIKPKVIIQLYETGPYAKAFEIVAFNHKIKTIGVQHGMLGFIPPEYTHSSLLSKNCPFGYSIPDSTFVFGEYDKQVITQIGHYPKNKVEIIGNPTLYKVNQIRKILSKDKIKKSYGIQDQKVILIPLSFRIGLDTRKNSELILLDTLYKEYCNNDKTIFLIRPHPGDSITKNDLQKIYPTKNFIFSKKSLFEDIFVSDLVVLTFSSVGCDAVLFEKPVFYVTTTENGFPDDKPMYSFIKKNQAAKVIDLSELIPAVNNTKNDELWEIEKSQPRKEFLKFFFNYGVENDIMKLIYN